MNEHGESEKQEKESAFARSRKRMLEKQKKIKQHQRKKSGTFEGSKQRQLAKQEAIHKVKLKDDYKKAKRRLRKKQRSLIFSSTSSPYLFYSNANGNVHTPQADAHYDEYLGEIALQSPTSTVEHSNDPSDKVTCDPHGIYE